MARYALNLTSTMPVQLTHPTGASMRHSESLASFLRQRPRQGEPFFLGDWLASIDDTALEHFRSLASRARNGDRSSATDDLLVVALSAQAAEMVKAEHEVTEDVVIDWINILHVASAIESYRRRGWLVLDRALSIQVEVKVSLRITEEGAINIGALRQGLH
jgi:hypothetical protein